MIVAGLELTRLTSSPSCRRTRQAWPMTIGPYPITRTDFRSARRVMAPASGRPGVLHQLAELAEQAGRVVRPRGCLGVVLHAEGGRREQPQALDHAIVQVHMADHCRAIRGLEWLLPTAGGGRPLPLSARFQRLARTWQRDSEPVIVAGDLDPPGAQVLHRLVHAPVAEPQLVRAQAERPAEDLAAQADPEDRQASAEHAAHRLDRVAGRGRIAGP